MLEFITFDAFSPSICILIKYHSTSDIHVVFHNNIVYSGTMASTIYKLRDVIKGLESNPFLDGKTKRTITIQVQQETSQTKQVKMEIIRRDMNEMRRLLHLIPSCSKFNVFVKMPIFLNA